MQRAEGFLGSKWGAIGDFHLGREIGATGRLLGMEVVAGMTVGMADV